MNEAEADTAERFARLESLFSSVVDLAPDARESLLAALPSDELDIVGDVRALLSAHARAESLSGFAKVSAVDGADLSGMRLGAFVVGGLIGMGGMGAVHEGTRADDQYKQRVALKFLRRTGDETTAVRRFRAEQQILASLHHPHIAQLLDGGVTPTGTPYFVMEYIDGAPITHWCDARQITIRKRLELIREVCRAVRAAHQQLVVHRDLKPSNILVTSDGAVKLLDFGIAKLLGDAVPASADESPVTALGQQAFTPEYAAPEQVRGELVDTRADIYSLGVVLFELLAGRRPITYASTSPVAMVQHLEHATVPSLADAMDAERWRALSERSHDRARRHMSRDLDAVVRMALRSEPSRRYGSVDALLDDLDRLLDGRPVAARADGRLYHARKFVARHAAATVAATVAVASLITGTFISQRQARRAESEGERAREVTAFLTTMLGASSPEAFGKDVTMRLVLDSAARRLDATKLSSALDADLRDIVGGTYIALGEFGEAARQLERGLTGRRALAPRGDYQTALTLSRLSLVHESNGKFEQADSLLAMAEQLYERYPHPDALEEVAALENRSRVLHRLGKGTAALAALRRAFAISRARGKADHPAMASTYINAAVITSDLGERIEADSLAARGYAIARRVHGDGGALTLAALAVYSGTQERLGHVDEAERILRAVLAGRKRLLGEQHPDYAYTMFNLADHLMRRQRWSEAADWSRRVLALRGSSLDDSHPAIAVSMQYLGRSLGHLDSVAEGERWLRASLALRRRNLPAGHWLLASSESALGENLVLAKRYPEAERVLLAAEAQLVKSQGEKSSIVSDVRERIVGLYVAWGKDADAEKWRARM